MRRTLAILAAVVLIVATGCAGETSAGVAGEPSGSAVPSPSPSPSAMASIDPEGELCLRVGEMQARLDEFLVVELVLANRTSLEIELDKLQAAYSELERSELGDREDELEDSLKRLGYRLGELELAVMDYKTNPKPRRAAPHVEEDSRKVANELNAFVALSRC